MLQRSPSPKGPSSGSVILAGERGRSRALGGPVQVDGYTRPDGTYVQPYQRTAPDRSPFNNYDMPGNYNPNTRTITPGDPGRCLERYERERGR